MPNVDRRTVGLNLILIVHHNIGVRLETMMFASRGIRKFHTGIWPAVLC